MSNKMIHHTLSTLLAISLTGISTTTQAETDSMGEAPSGMEKCYGIAKAGRNDCGTRSYRCAGEAKLNGDREAWLLVPTGLCERIVNGITKPPIRQR